MLFKKFALLTLTVIAFVLIPNFGFAVLTGNHTQLAYSEPDTSSSFGEVHSIKFYIEVAGGHYFMANADIQQLMNRFELQDIDRVDMTEMSRLVDNAIANMNCALETYKLLIEKAEKTPYNQVILDELKNYEYDDFLVLYRLNRDVFDTVEGLLKKGDITGVYRVIHAKCQAIIAGLENVKEFLGQGVLPDQADFWKLNEMLAQTSLFGSYVARIFFTLM